MSSQRDTPESTLSSWASPSSRNYLLLFLWSVRIFKHRKLFFNKQCSGGEYARVQTEKLMDSGYGDELLLRIWSSTFRYLYVKELMMCFRGEKVGI